MAFEKKGDINFNSIYDHNLSLPSKKCNKKRQVNNPMVKNKDEVPVGNRCDNSSCSWSISAEEDYIVLCFREDGVCDDVKDGKGVNFERVIKNLDGKHKNSRPVNRKLKYYEEEEQVRDLNMIDEKRSNANEQDTNQDCITLFKEDEKNTSRHQYKDHSIRRSYQIEGNEEFGIVSAESRDSHQSASSAGSFAFPLLGWEWLESPVQMPKSEGQHLKKQKPQFVRFQCCRF